MEISEHGEQLEVIDAIFQGKPVGERRLLEKNLERLREEISEARDSAKSAPDQFLPVLAKKLEESSDILLKLDNPGDSLEAIREVNNIYGQLAEKQPEVYLPLFAASLNHCGNVLNYLGQTENALRITELTVKVTRQLCEKIPDAFNRNLAITLHNLGKLHLESARNGPALAAVSEAVQLFRKGGEDSKVELALTLRMEGAAMRMLNRMDESISSLRDSVGLLRELAEVRPGVFLPELGSTLRELGFTLGRAERYSEAEQVFVDSLEIVKNLYDEEPDDFILDFADTLINFGSVLSRLDKDAEALEKNHKAVEILREVLEMNSPEVSFRFIAALGNQGNLLRRLRRFDESLTIYDEAIAHGYEFIRNNGEGFEELMIGNLSGKEKTLQESGRGKLSLEDAAELEYLNSILHKNISGSRITRLIKRIKRWFQM